MTSLDPSSVPSHRVRLLVRGRVQGVGFRPTIAREMAARGCGGSIRNTPEGVVVEIEGPFDVVDALVEAFDTIVPARAVIDELIVEDVAPLGETEFRIEPSSDAGPSLLPIPADLALCAGCVAELDDPACRRAGYAFDTCTACGPRFTIARAVPFDRPTSAMDEFPLCEACAAEYASAADRRFHAQTMSCPDCGPALAFRGAEPDGTPLEATARALADGRIVAIKGIGGFHLACDATRGDVVAELRRRKGRPHKPFAVMVRDVEAARRLCHVDDTAAALLEGAAAPIVLMPTRDDAPVADAVAPALRDLGVMIAYAPLHRLLFDEPATPDVLVMTSCNRSDEPIAVSATEVESRLGGIVDAVLDHDRPILNRCDDSLVATFDGRAFPMRRSRGYVPEPVMLAADGPATLGAGAMWKNTFALTSGRRAFLSEHIGDVSDADNAAHFAESLARFSELLRLEPELVACDLHPDYPTTQFAHEFAAERGLDVVGVQHHHAHAAACLAEHGESGPVIAVSMDGTGYGEDGAVWGGEFLVADLTTCERLCHLEYVPMPGGDRAVLEPARMAIAHAAAAFDDEEAVRRLAKPLGEDVVRTMLTLSRRRAFSPLTSSCGRLFDAVAAMIGVRAAITYEGQAACELEAVAATGEDGAYDFGYDGRPDVARTSPMIRGVLWDVERGVAAPVIAARFHNTVSNLIAETCRRLGNETKIRTVALTGGVMQNRTLLARTVPILERDGFRVLTHRLVPPGDGGVCLGQVAVARARQRH